MKKFMAVLLSAALPLFSACAAETKYESISQDKAKSMMDGGGVIVVDVRELWEYNNAHIAGAINLPLGSIKDNAAEVLPDKDAVILVYCQSGRRSKSGAQALAGLGYTKVYEFGGIGTWQYGKV